MAYEASKLHMKKLLLVLSLAVFGPAVSTKAGVIINVSEVGGNVVFATSGSLDLTGATAVSTGSGYGQGFISVGSNWYVAPGPGGAWKSYALTSFDGAFGPSTVYQNSPSSSSGDTFFIWGYDGFDPRQVGVSPSYVSGGAITSGMVFNNTSIAALSMTAGTYNYRIANDTITLVIGGSVGVPDTGFTVSLLGFALAGLAACRRKLS
jgi:hypothetical protein